jgi:MSHA biogenesis protein MshM
MYLEHFDLQEFPFSITPGTQFFFASKTSQEALNTLFFAIRMGEGFMKVIGEVGSGKTLLCRKLIGSLGPDYTVAYILNPYLEPLALFVELASELGIDWTVHGRATQHEVLDALIKRVIALNLSGKRVVILLDEVQAMPIETLEALRLLTNLETENRKLLQVVIFGQPELDARLEHDSVRQLRQRITFHYRLKPLSRSEFGYYLQHRLTVAGYRRGQLFSPLALRLLQHKSRRIPRLINILANKAMFCAYGRGRKMVVVRDVIRAARDTDSLSGVSRRRLVQHACLALSGLAAAAAAWAYWS